MAKEEPTPPRPEIVAAIQAALAEPGMLRKVVGFARKRVFVLRRFGVGVHLDADDLVHQVVVDTLSGVLTWDPDKVALLTHLCGAISGRTAKLIDRQKPAAPESLIDRAVAATLIEPRDRLAPKDRIDPVAVRGSMVELDPVGTTVWRRDAVRKVKDYLFRVAGEKGDEEVQFILMAYEQGAEGRSAIAEATGLTPAQVTNARKRLDRYIRDMPQELAEDA